MLVRGSHEDFGCGLDALTLGLTDGILVELGEEVEGGLIRLEDRHMFCCGLDGHDVPNPTLEP